MSDANPYAAPEGPSQDPEFIDFEMVVDEKLLLEGLIEDKRITRGASSRGVSLFLLIDCLIAVASAALILLPVPIPNRVQIFSPVFFCTLLGGVAVSVVDQRWRRKKLAAEAVVDLQEMIARMPSLRFGIWQIHFDPERLRIFAPGGGFDWQLTDVRALTLSQGPGVIYLRTPDFLLLIPRERIGREIFADLVLWLWKHKVKSIELPKNWF